MDDSAIKMMRLSQVASVMVTSGKAAGLDDGRRERVAGGEQDLVES